MRKQMKRVMVMAMAVMVLFTITPNTAEAGAKKAITVTVKNAKTSGSRKVVERKKKAQVIVKYGKKTVTKKAKYKTSNKKVATVSKKGVITAKKAGNCTIRVSYKGKKKNIHVKVANPAVKKKTSGGGNKGNSSGGSGSGNNGNTGSGNSSGNNGNTGSGNSSSGNNGNTGSGNGSSGNNSGITGGNPGCVHAWQAETENKWVEDWKYVKTAIVHCDCGATFRRTMESEKSVEEERKHTLNHLLKGEGTGKWDEIVDEWMDCDSYQNVTYYKCTKCGAIKN